MRWTIDPATPPANPDAATRYAEALAARVLARTWLIQRQHDGTWTVTHTPTQRTMDGCPSEELARACIASGKALRMLADCEGGRLGIRTDEQVRGTATAA